MTEDGSLNDPFPSEHAEVVLEGYLLKRSNLTRNWNKRYFVFTADGNLAYYKTGDETGDSQQRKKEVLINKESGCEIGNLYVDQRQRGAKKELLYCIRLTWPDTEDLKVVGANKGDDNSSSMGLNNIDFSKQVLPSSPHQSMDDYSEPHIRTPRSMDDSEEMPYTPKDSSNAGGPRRRYLKRRSSWHVFSRGKTVSSQDGVIMEENKMMPTSPEKTVAFAPPLEASTSLGGACMTPTRSNRIQNTYEEAKVAEQDLLRSEYLWTKKENKKKAKKKVIQGAKLTAATSAAIGIGVITAGVGLATGLAFLGVAAGAAGGSGASAVFAGKRKNQIYELIIGTENYEAAKLWKSSLDAFLQFETVKESTWGQMFVSGGNHSKSAFFPSDISFPMQSRDISSLPTADINDLAAEMRQRAFFGDRTLQLEVRNQWQPLEGGWAAILGNGVQGLRVFKLEKEEEPFNLQGSAKSAPRVFSNLSVDGPPCPPMKSHVVLNSTPLNAFLCLMSNARVTPTGVSSSICPKSEQGASFRIIESLDDHMDVIHLVFRPIYLFPSWTSPRDFVLVRYWRIEPDGSYVVCYDSVKHQNCPVQEDYVRGEMHQVFTISPIKKSKRSETRNQSECLCSAVVQVDPKGWIPTTTLPLSSLQAYGDAFGVAALLQLLDIRDAIDRDRFTPVSMDMELPTHQFKSRLNQADSDIGVKPLVDEDMQDDYASYDFSYTFRETQKVVDSATGLISNPPPFHHSIWAEPDANSFRVRGPDYLTDRKKINAGSSIARLITADMIEVDKPLYSGICEHPGERIQLALQKEKLLKEKGLKSDFPPFVFIVNILVPGDPSYHAVFYYAVDDMSTIDGSDGLPSSKLAKEFFFGESDSFRDSTFKLIPQIVEGNFIVRKAVGSTPAIMGRKIRSVYIKKDRYFELILDTASSSVAQGVIGMCRGYAKTLVVDLGFLLEGDDVTTLPEKIFGCLRLKNIDFEKARKLGSTE